MQIKCPHCGAVLNASGEAAGATATCKICGGKFEIPAPVAQPVDAAAAPAATTPAAAARNPAADPSLSQSRMFPPDPDLPPPETETDVWVDSPSQWVGMGAYFWTLLIAIVFMVAGVLLHRYFLIGLLLPVLMVLIKFFSIKATRYELTTQRLQIHSGIMDRKEIEVELFRLRDLSVEQSFLQRLVNVGTVEAQSSDKDAPAVRLTWVNTPEAVKDKRRTYLMQARRATGTTDIDMTMTGRPMS
jgi:membrane protein YdbS with pleckstrin-like domain